ncbi:Mercuric reductase [Rhodobacteraceae bacterium THAF1]|uniref:dihydrolipoyl dehydrogenase family protein n=1 Tax=Palleronia sp. THAF1 TaxID=2587842 RepID=UPI000F3D8864|nr:FAD-dependent oxidoreductase [Palleronia sp. THAF1]QFU07683.1 Mercuric reductase [Palleronia sp. THAF1]VDC23138.1 Mercuric reductase [Rhodobacteraceae bacterium THAF1]
MEKIKCDVCIIGAGSGGLSVAAGAAQMGAKVVLIEGHKMGGDCLNYGCVPSKSLIASAKAAYGMSHPGEIGVASAEPKVDYAEAKDHVARVVETIAPVDSQERFEGFGITVLREWASFKDEKTIVTDTHEITARRIVIATGSSPFVPPIDGLDGVDYLTNETLFDLREKPEHLIVIGGGPIGMEMAQAHRRLGCEVTVIEGGKALGKDDPEATSVVLEQIQKEGVVLVEGQQAKRVSQSGGKITVETDGGSYTGSHLLVAVGRKVNIDKLDLDKGNVAHDRAVTVDDRLRSTTNKRVFAVGDAAGRLQFTHVAGYHAGVVIPQIMFGLPTKAKQSHIPWATYTSPELAHVGLTEQQAREEHGGNVKVVRFNYDENDRAIATEKTTGFVKVLVVRGKPVGATIVGESAGELISMWSMAIANGLKMKAISDTVLPYPTLAEINKRAAGAYFSPMLFENDTVKTVVRLVQKYLP